VSVQSVWTLHAKLPRKKM